MSARAAEPGNRDGPGAYEPPLPGAPRPDPHPLPDEDTSPPDPAERHAKRALLRATRLLIGAILLLFAIGLLYRLLARGA